MRSCAGCLTIILLSLLILIALLVIGQMANDEMPEERDFQALVQESITTGETGAEVRVQAAKVDLVPGESLADLVTRIEREGNLLTTPSRSQSFIFQGRAVYVGRTVENLPLLGCLISDVDRHVKVLCKCQPRYERRLARIRPGQSVVRVRGELSAVWMFPEGTLVILEQCEVR
jgi:hypothetical protein